MADPIIPSDSTYEAFFKAALALCQMAGTTLPVITIDPSWIVERKACAAIIALQTGGIIGDGITQLTGDVTASGPGIATATLTNTGVSPDTYTNPTLTVDSKGRITHAEDGTAGGVSSVGLSMPSIFNVSGSPVTTTGTLTATLANQAVNRVFAGPAAGPSSAPTFRALVAADLPGLIPVGSNPTATIGLASVNGVATTYLRSDGAPALSQAIAPTWTAQHRFQTGIESAPYLIGADTGANTITNNTIKRAWTAVPNYANAEEPLLLISARSGTSEGLIEIGGGSSLHNSATSIIFYTASSSTTVMGSTRLSLNSAGQANFPTTTDSSSSITGSVITGGGMGIAKRLFVGTDITAPQLISTVATGTAPMVVASTTLVANLHAATADAIPVSGLTGLGTGVATALAVNVGSSGAFVVNGGALGAPSSGTLTNLTGYTLNNIAAASAATAISNGDFNIVWRWTKTTNNTQAFFLGENSASTGGTVGGTGVPQQAIFAVSTTLASTASPFQVSVRTAYAFGASNTNPQLIATTGSAAIPVYSFAINPTTGLFTDNSTPLVGVSVSASEVARFVAGGLTMASGTDINLGNAYVATPQVSTGYVTMKDSTGTTYKFLVAP